MTPLDNENLFSRIRNRISDENAPLIHLPDGEVITYGDMLARTAQIANVLVELGVQPGDRVAIQAEKCIDGLFLYLGCVRAGGVFLPLNSAYRDRELDYFIGDAGPRVFVSAPERKAAVEEIAARHGVAHVETLSSGGGSLAEKADGAATSFEDVARGKDDLAAILYTSGTTGRSKGAMLSHGNLASDALTLSSFWRFSKDDVLLHVLPIFHTHGLFVASNTTMMAGASMIFHQKFQVDDVIADLPRASVMMGVPTFYVRLLACPAFNREVTAGMRLFTSGSAPLSPQTHKEFEERTGHTILERYGMTETSMNTSNPYDGERRPGTVGFALPGVKVRICDAKTGLPVADGEVGIIEIRGPNVFKGYWQMPEKTAEEFRDDGFFISGDMARVDEDGYISIVGRNKDLVITGGFNVYPAEVENAIDAIDGVAESAVIGLPHKDFGEAVTAVVVASGEGAPDANAIRAQLSGELAKFKVPKEIIFVDALPRNKMGKVQKNQLRETYKGLYEA